MKFVVLSLLCLLIGVLAFPSALGSPTQQNSLPALRAKRASGSDSMVVDLVASVADKLLNVLRVATNESGLEIPASVLKTLQGLINGELTLNDLDDQLSPENIKDFIKQINPLNDMLKLPMVNDLYNSILDLVATPLSVISTALTSVAQILIQVLSALLSVAPIPIP